MGLGARAKARVRPPAQQRFDLTRTQAEAMGLGARAKARVRPPAQQRFDLTRTQIGRERPQPVGSNLLLLWPVGAVDCVADADRARNGGRRHHRRAVPRPAQPILKRRHLHSGSRGVEQARLVGRRDRQLGRRVLGHLRRHFRLERRLDGGRRGVRRWLDGGRLGRDGGFHRGGWRGGGRNRRRGIGRWRVRHGHVGRLGRVGGRVVGRRPPLAVHPVARRPHVGPRDRGDHAISRQLDAQRCCRSRHRLQPASPGPAVGSGRLDQRPHSQLRLKVVRRRRSRWPDFAQGCLKRATAVAAPAEQDCGRVPRSWRDRGG
eukprot:scaffold4536_cov113-Isochrysis_galbana.AAC.14